MKTPDLKTKAGFRPVLSWNMVLLLFPTGRTAVGVAALCAVVLAVVSILVFQRYSIEFIVNKLESEDRYERSIDRLEELLASAETRATTAETRARKLNFTLITMQRREARLRQELGATQADLDIFRRTLSDEQLEGVRVVECRLYPIPGESKFRLQTTLLSGNAAESHRGQISGRIVGTIGNSQVSYRLRDTAVDVDARALEFDFRLQVRIDTQIGLPDGFTLNQLMLVAEVQRASQAPAQRECDTIVDI